MKTLLTTIAVLILFSCTENKPKEVLHTENSDLKVGEATPVATLKQHVADTFRLDLDSGVFVYGAADQRTVDVVVEIYGPDKAKLEGFDSPSRGPESFSFNSKSSGVHRIVISPFKEKQGDYTLVINGAERVATDLEGRADQYMRAVLGEGNVTPGATVAVQKDGKIIFSKAYGYADVESESKNTPATIFHIASVSKQFTAFAIALLADQGKLSLDDDIRKYLPEMHDFGDVITINHLVHHTSGLRDQWNLLVMAGWQMDDVITQKQIMRVVSRQKELNFKPGEEYLYCNTGFTLMAEIVSRVTGENFADWTKKNIFDPLEMKNTQFYMDHERIVKNRAYSYQPGGDGVLKKSVLSYANAGATSLFTTVEDLSLWAVNFETMKVGNPKVMDMMNQRFVLNRGDTINYALGQVITKYKGLKSISHGGGDAGYRTFLLRFPDQHVSISAFSNLGSLGTGGLSYVLADIILAGDLKPEKPSNVPPPPPDPVKESFDPKTKLADFVGKYYSEELETRYTLELVSDTLRAHHQRHDDQTLFPATAEAFDTPMLGTVQFFRNQSGKVVGFKATDGRVRNLVFIKE